MTTIDHARLADRIRDLRRVLPQIERAAREDVGDPEDEDEGILGAECSRAMAAEVAAKADLQACLLAYFDQAEARR